MKPTIPSTKKQMSLFDCPSDETLKKNKKRKKLAQIEIPPEGWAKPEWPVTYITEYSSLGSVVEDLLKYRAIGFDIETTGLDPHDPNTKIRLLQFARPGKTWVVDLFMVKDIGPLANIITSNKVTKVGHYLKFECSILMEILKCEPKRLFCTYVAAKLLSAGERKECTLAAVAKENLNVSLNKEEQISDWNSPNISTKQIEYAALDAEIALKVSKVQLDKLIQESLQEIALLEFNLIAPVVQVELNGIFLNTVKWMDNAYSLEKSCRSLESELQQEAEKIGLLGFNPRSVPQKLKLLQLMGLNISSTDESTMKRYRNQLPIIDTMLEFSDIQKKVSSWGEKYLEYINPYTGRIHPTFDSLGTATGRYACNTPNLQQIPRTKVWRSCFIPQPGFVFVVTDYSQIELRVAGEMTQDPAMLYAYRNGIDIHRLTASTVFGCKPEEVTKEQRQASKAINFGLIYSMSAKGLKTYARDGYGVHMTDADAEAFRQKYFNLYKEVKKWHRETYKKIENGMKEVRTVGGRLRKWSPDTPIWIGAALNTPVQGTAADGMKQAQIILHNQLKQFDKKDVIGAVNLIHDEVVIEVRKEMAEDVKVVVEQSLIKGMQTYIHTVPVEVETGVGTSWADK